MISLREAMGSLLEESFVRQRSLGVQSPLGLSVDLRETPDRFVLTASVPGVDPADVSITVLGDTVRISGERRDDLKIIPGSEEGRWLIRERHFGPFDRSIKLPAVVDPDTASARFQDGVLIIEMPKAEQSKPRTIPVRAPEPTLELESSS